MTCVCLQYLQDEVHAIGLYGESGAGISEKLGKSVQDKVDIITGTLGKAVACGGGYIAGNLEIIDVIRRYIPQLIL